MPSPEAATEVSSSKLSALPNEILMQTISFLSLPDACVAKAVSDGVCRAVSFALKRGRWAGIARIVSFVTGSDPYQIEEEAEFYYEESQVGLFCLGEPPHRFGARTPNLMDLFKLAWAVREPHFLLILFDALRLKVGDEWMGTLLGNLLYAVLPTVGGRGVSGEFERREIDFDDVELVLESLMKLSLFHSEAALEAFRVWNRCDPDGNGSGDGIGFLHDRGGLDLLFRVLDEGCGMRMPKKSALSIVIFATHSPVGEVDEGHPYRVHIYRAGKREAKYGVKSLTRMRHVFQKFAAREGDSVDNLYFALQGIDGNMAQGIYMDETPTSLGLEHCVLISCFDRDTMDSEVPQRVSECFRGSKFIAGVIESLTGFFDDGDEFFTDDIVQEMTADWPANKRADVALAFENKRNERYERILSYEEDYYIDESEESEES